MSKTISFGLSVSEVNQAIKELEQYKIDFNRKVDLLVEALVNLGVKATKDSITQLDAIYTGELLNSISGIYYPNTGIGAIYTDCAWSKFVLFGTGIKGANAPSKYATKFNWKYDVNDHGESGWMYFKDGEWHWTQGMPSRDFFGDAITELRLQLDSTAKSIFKS